MTLEEQQLEPAFEFYTDGKQYLIYAHGAVDIKPSQFPLGRSYSAESRVMINRIPMLIALARVEGIGADRDGQ